MNYLLFLILTFASAVPFTGRLNLITIDTNETDSSTWYYLDSSESGHLTIEFPYEPAPSAGGFMVIHGNMVDGILVAQNHTILPENHLELSDGLENSRFQGERSVGVFFFDFIGRKCGYSGSDSECRYCRSFNDTLNFFYQNPDSNAIGYFNEVSEGTVKLLINQSSVFRVQTDQSPTNLYGSFDSIIKAATGVDPKDYNHAVFLLPWNWMKISPFTSFSLQGVGETPGKRTWIKGCEDSTILHELGHNFNFGHTNAFDRNDNPREYYDGSSVMGRSFGRVRRGFNSYHRVLNNWLPSDAVNRTSKFGNWLLNPLNGNGLRVVIFSYNGVDYYISLRERSGYDKDLLYPIHGSYPKGNYYDTLLVQVGEIVNGYREDTSLLAIIPVNSTYTIDTDLRIGHFYSFGNLSIGNVTAPSGSGSTVVKASISLFGLLILIVMIL